MRRLRRIFSFTHNHVYGKRKQEKYIFHIFLKVGSLSFSDVFEDLFGVNFGFDFLGCENFLYYTFFIYQISGSQYTDGATTACNLFSPTAKLLKQGRFRVGNERKLQSMGIGKLLLKRLFVFAHPYDFVTCLCQLLLVRLKRTSLRRATARIRFWVGVKAQSCDRDSLCS